MTSSMRAIVYSTDYTNAMILSENKMVAELGQIATTDENLSSSSLNQKFKFAIKNNAFTDESKKNLQQIDAKISWNTKGKNNSFSLNTYSYKSNEK